MSRSCLYVYSRSPELRCTFPGQTFMGAVQSAVLARLRRHRRNSLRQVAVRCFDLSGTPLPVRTSRPVGPIDITCDIKLGSIGPAIGETAGVEVRENGKGARDRKALRACSVCSSLKLFIPAQIALPTSTAKLTSSNFYDASALTLLRRHPHGQNFDLYEGLPNSV